MNLLLEEYVNTKKEIYRLKCQEIDSNNFNHLYGFVLDYLDNINEGLRDELKCKYNSQHMYDLIENIVFDIMYGSFNLDMWLLDEYKKLSNAKFAYLFEYIENNLKEDFSNDLIKKYSEEKKLSNTYSNDMVIFHLANEIVFLNSHC
jgi:hypothetical protein